MKMMKKAITFTIIIALVMSSMIYIKSTYVKATEETEDQWGQNIDNPWIDLIKNETKTTGKETGTASSETVTSSKEWITSEESLSSEEKTSTSKETFEKKVKIIKVASKKKSAKKVKITITKIENANGYQVCVYRKKADAKKNRNVIYKKTIKKNIKKLILKNKKLKNKKKLFIRVRAYKLNATGKKTFGSWSIVKKVKIKK